MKTIAASLIFICASLSAHLTWSQPTAVISSIKFLGVRELPYNMSFQGTTVGGLSGIDYDPASHVYYLISDDRSALQPARFYTASIHISERGIDSVSIRGIVTLTQPNGKPYPGAREDPANTPDPEAIRYNSHTKQLVWTSEGERIFRGTQNILANPSITSVDTEGRYQDMFPIPSHLHMQSIEKGPRQNGTLEGLTFADDFKTLYTTMEEPLFEDGPRAGLKDNNAWIRIYQYEVASKKNVAQYAYRLEPVAYPPMPSTAFMVNGVPDILSLGSDKLLAIERSFSTGRLPCTVKLFVADLHAAENILSVASLIEHPPTRPVVKKLLLNLDDLGIYIDNVEGATLGPDLPNGHKTLILVADNNFNLVEKTQFLLFEIIP